MERDLARRYGTAEQVIEDLNALRAGQPLKHLQALGRLTPSNTPTALQIAIPTVVQGALAPAPEKSLVDDLLDGGDTPMPRPIPRVAHQSIPWGMVGAIGALLLGVAAVWAVLNAQRDRPPRRPPPPPPATEAAPGTGLQQPPPPPPRPGEPGFVPPPRRGEPGFRPPPRRGEPGFRPLPPSRRPAARPRTDQRQ